MEISYLYSLLYVPADSLLKVICVTEVASNFIFWLFPPSLATKVFPANSFTGIIGIIGAGLSEPLEQEKKIVAAKRAANAKQTFFIKILLMFRIVFHADALVNL